VRRAVLNYRSIPQEDVRIVLVHSGTSVLEREVTPRLATYATTALAEQGIELVLGERLVAASPQSAVLSDGRRISTRTLISTVPSSPNPVVEQLGPPAERGRLECDATMAVKGVDGVWAVGDCALIPMPGGKPCPPTAQHAVRHARVLAGDIVARHTGAPLRPFRFTGPGKLSALGPPPRRRRAARRGAPGGVTGLADVARRLLVQAPGSQSQDPRRDLVGERPGAPAPPRPA
jgi:NADH:ubiquinone reductase (H+-translocating)